MPRALLIAALLALVAAPTRADTVIDDDNDEPPVAAIIPFVVQAPGDAAQVNAACAAALRHIAGLKVITAEEWDKEARASGAGDDLEAMARRLGADVLITGSLSRVGPPPLKRKARPRRGPAAVDTSPWRLGLDIFDEHATPVRSVALELPGPRVGPAAAYLMEEALDGIVRPAVGLQLAAAPAGDAPAIEPAPQSADRDRPVEVAAPQFEPLHPRPKVVIKTRPLWAPIIEAHAGVLVMGRQLTCGEVNSARLNLPCSAPAFPLDAGGGLRLDATLFPFRLADGLPPALAAVGLSALIEAPFWRARTDPSDPTSGVAVHELRFEGGLRGRWALGERSLPRPLLLEAGAAYGYHQFVADAALPYPSVQYQYLLPSIGAGGFLLPQLSLRASAGLLGTFTAGDASAPRDQRNQNPFGPGTVIGFRLLLEAEYFLYQGLGLGLGGYAEQMNFFLSGQGCTKGTPGQALCDQDIARDIHAAPPDPLSRASDLYFGLWLSLGYHY